MPTLSKSKLMAYRQCPRRLWLQTYRPDCATPSASNLSRLHAGTRLGEIARDLYPGGQLIDASKTGEALDQTRQAIASRMPIYEGAFQVENVLIRADLLIPDGDAFHLIEAKSSARLKDHHVPDAAVQAWVIQSAGTRLTSTSVCHIDRSFTYTGDGNYNGLLTEVDITDRVTSLLTEIPAWVQAANGILARDEPEISTGDHCKKPHACPFQENCAPPAGSSEKQFPPGILPNGGKAARDLEQAGYTDLRDVPAGLLTSPQHQRVWRATCRDEAELLPGAKAAIQAIGFPRYYLDFETVQSAIPLWAGTHPYDQIPFQWSCHVEQACGKIQHHEFLAGDPGDPRRAFAESLASLLAEPGPVLVYNAAFERARMREMAALFPDLAPPLRAGIRNMVDLLPIARENYYHPDMRGSWSIKAVLPTIAPELSYDELSVGDGRMAQEAFTEMIDPATADERRQALYVALLKYCEMDTLAMVKIAHFFEGRTPPG